ncbi:MAG: hypothetical protein DDG60_09585 [Anaerolineae bacterium]|nr:MAG: hypothetical protein DDG60_09585 [Anaerolineae bacterium]
MSWTAYQVVLRLHSPLHIGAGRVSYLQRARPYVTGRALRGALVSRVGRNQPELLSDEPRDPYRRISKTFATYMAFTYFYPALKSGDHWKTEFPWQNEPEFRRRFLSSYAATALAYPQQTAAEGLLYETEFLSPYTLDTGEPVYLLGYIFVEEERLKPEKYDWKSALCRLQLGGERGYGWGEARLVENGLQKLSETDRLFSALNFSTNQKRPIVHLQANQPVLAHTESQSANLRGMVEPMVGREWQADNTNNERQHVGQRLRYNGIYFSPGSIALCETAFTIEEGGYWKQQE